MRRDEFNGFNQLGGRDVSSQRILSLSVNINGSGFKFGLFSVAPILAP